MGAITLSDRFQGAMVGALAGDASGAPYENSRAAVIAEDIKRRGGLVLFDYVDPWKGEREVKKGHPTDDAELAAVLGLSLVADPELNVVEFYDLLRSFIHGRKSILTTDEAYGSGGTLRRALRPLLYVESCAAFARGEIPLVPSNGSLMRDQAVGLCAHGDVNAIVRLAARQSNVTHRHPVAEAACVVYAVMMSQLLSGLHPDVAWHRTVENLWDHNFGRTNEMLRPILACNFDQPSENEIWPRTGGALISFRIALWSLFTSSTFRDGIRRAVLVGGDTDTYAAIAGGLLGARYGLSGIPQEWRDVLIGREIMVKIGSDLHDIATRRLRG